MGQTPSLELRVKQSPSLRQMQRLIMSPQMQQAITVMQMPILELSNRLEEEITQNPILENSEDEALDQDQDLELVWDEESDERDLSPEHELHFDDHNFEILKRIDEDFRNYMNEASGFSLSRTNEEEKLKAFMESSLQSKETLFEHLMLQAREIFHTDNEQAMAEAIIGNFDDSGFFKESLSEIAVLNNFEENELEVILESIQHFEPIGVGARNLQESLLIQLEAQDKKETLAYAIISECYDDLLHNRIPLIQKKLKCTNQELVYAIEEEIAKLELHPGSGFNQPFAFPIVPDATISQEDDQLCVTVNDESLPQIRFNRRYMNMLEDPNLSIETRDFIKQKILSAQWFLQNIHQRNTTIERIVNSLAKRQYQFFSNPDGQLSPLTMKVLADELNLHESTIARAVANKYVYSPRGLFPLRFFFSNAYLTSQGEDLSSKTVRDKLQALIKNENKQKPLSDEALSLLLQAQGITCARRTIAKYRASLNLGNAHQRKKFGEQ
ncbi:MAG: RNA polymerase factor sigma-54 [Parachlamydiaceae bacterium]